MRMVLAVIMLFLWIPAASAQDTHTVAPGESLMHISQQVNVCVETILDANPNLKPFDIFDIQTGDRITIPSDTPACYSDGASTFAYTIEAGDTLFGLSIFYGVPVMSIINATPNGPANMNLIEPDQVLNVPISTEERTDYSYFPFVVTYQYSTYMESEALSAFTHRMRFDLQYIARWNDLPLDAYIHRGQPIYVVRESRFPARTSDVPSHYRTAHLVRWTDTLLNIALEYDVSAEALMEFNHIDNPHFINALHVIFIPDSMTADPTPVAPDSTTYRAHWGDSLSSIAQAYSTLPQLIALVNNVPDPNSIDIGDTFSIPAYIRVSTGIPQIAALSILVPSTLLVTTRLLDRRKSKPKRKPKQKNA